MAEVHKGKKLHRRIHLSKLNFSRGVKSANRYKIANDEIAEKRNCF